ncbi:hypothetical protein C8F04DRAFT_1269568 [Mycena alexandri]|uniref:Uncharacterized protein n=1 Tax=Mycena alexandri TaxID=1745969 RepID=A0AAD6WU91_9AGAR|nr:hypothetical protein C8F04DRAFT_1269568 [Mycena alexandri]
MANSNLKRLTQGAKTGTSGWYLGATSRVFTADNPVLFKTSPPATLSTTRWNVLTPTAQCTMPGHTTATIATAIAGCTLCASTYFATSRRMHPPTPTSTPPLGPPHPPRCLNKHISCLLLYGRSCTHRLICAAPTSFCLPDPCAVKRAHIDVAQHRCAPISAAGGIFRLVTVAQLPLSFSTSQPGHAHVIPISLSSSLQRSSRKKRSAEPVPVLNMKPDSIGLVPKPEPESDAVKRQVTNPIKRERKLSPHL